MITISRLLARQVRAVVRRALGITPRGLASPVIFQAGPSGLRIHAKSLDAAVEYALPGHLAPEEITVPFGCLADCEGRREEPVELELQADGRIAVRWRDGNVPQLVQYDPAAPPDSAEFPGLPEGLAENPLGLLAALHAAGETTDPDSVRFALGCIQLRGKPGSLAATDGRQLFVQSGFQFPWDEDLLVPKNTVFASEELAQAESVGVGRTGDWIVLRSGPWTLWLAIRKEGRFPDVSHHVPRADVSDSRLAISPADAEFLSKALPKLPCDETFNWPVTLELNGQVAIRGKPSDQLQPTELVLSGSRYSGQAVRINSNRKFLARALKLGFRELCLYGPKAPILAQDGGRSFVWALLDPECAIPASPSAIRIESQPSPSASTPHHLPKRKPMASTNPKPSDTTSANGKTRVPTASASEPKPKAEKAPTAVEQAIALRALLREAAAKATELIGALRQDKRQARQLRSALASLRELQAIDA